MINSLRVLVLVRLETAYIKWLEKVRCVWRQAIGNNLVILKDFEKLLGAV
jgi:hypothetical protein